MVGSGPNHENWVKQLLKHILYALASITVYLFLIQYCFTLKILNSNFSLENYYANNENNTYPHL